MSDKFKGFKIKVEGETKEKGWANLVSLICSCCQSKQENGDYPLWLTESEVGSIEVLLTNSDDTLTWVPEFGEQIKNPDASDSNPIKTGFFVEIVEHNGKVNKGKYYRCTDGKGNFWESKTVLPVN